jgi:hypothetical protein
MHRAAAIETSLALLLAFLLAPFQHVHTGSDHGDHHHAGEIHAHFFIAHAHSAPHATGGINAEAGDDDDDHAHARSVNTFTLVIPNGLPAFLPSRASATSLAPAETSDPLEIIEERAHAPPSLRTSTPRAPPL